MCKETGDTIKVSFMEVYQLPKYFQSFNNE
jgi:hypothetical protein